jgi:alpha-ketoglutarate-dependent taurine dioxygenase
MRRRPVPLSTADLVTSRVPDGVALPLVLEPAGAEVDLPTWVSDNRKEVFADLRRYGAVLFRGFGIDSVPAFEATAAAVCPALFTEYGDLPPEGASDRIYGSTPYPSDMTILFHNESSHLPRWPMTQMFCCLVASPVGGETPLLDIRRLCERIDPDVLREFETRGLLYVRNFSEGIDVPWQQFFHTDDRFAVERQCTELGMGYSWKGDGLMVTQSAPAVRRHPLTGDKVFFNQVQLHHVSSLDEATRASLLELFAPEDLPRNVLFGDGVPIPDDVMLHLGEVFDRDCVPLPWQPGDMIVLDNMLTSHGRRPFKGDRKIVVAMGDMAGDDVTTRWMA